MSFKVIKGWTLTVIAILVIAAGCILVISNLGYACKVHLFFEPVDGRTGLLMLASAAGGVVVMWMFVVLARGIKHIRKGRMEQAVIAALNPQPAAPAKDEPSTGGQGKA